MIIDFHIHCYTDELAKKATDKIPDPSLGPFFDGTLSGLKQYMSKYSIAKAIALHIANKPSSTVKVNDWAIYCNTHQNIMSFGSVHPYFELEGQGDIRAEIKRLKDNGIKGLKFHPYYQQYSLDDKKAYKVYEEGAKQGMIMLFHTGIDVLIKGTEGTSDKFARVIDDLKYDKIVGAHLGGSLTFKEAASLIWGKNVYLDTSLAFRFLSDDLKKQLMQSHDKNKLLFGSDGPWADPSVDYAIFDRFLNNDDKKLIYCDNAKKLLQIN